MTIDGLLLFRVVVIALLLLNTGLLLVIGFKTRSVWLRLPFNGTPDDGGEP